MPRALIVGGGGLSEALSRAYLDRGWEVQVVLRSGGAWACDLSRPDEVSALLGDPARVSGFDLCAVVAGVSHAGHADQIPPGAYRECMEVAFLAPIAFVGALARAERPCRRFILVLSGAADLPVPGLGPYALAKRALRDWIALVRMEGSFLGCRFLEVRPGPMATGFDAKTRLHGGFRLPRSGSPRSPDEVARRIVEAEERGQSSLTLSPLARVLGWLVERLLAARR